MQNVRLYWLDEKSEEHHLHFQLDHVPTPNSYLTISKWVSTEFDDDINLRVLEVHWEFDTTPGSPYGLLVCELVK